MKNTIISLLAFVLGALGGLVSRDGSGGSVADASTSEAPRKPSSAEALPRAECERQLSAALATGDQLKIEHWARRLKEAGGVAAAQKALADVEKQRVLRNDPFAEWERLSKAESKTKSDNVEKTIRDMAARDPRRAWDALTAAGARASLSHLEIVADEWGRRQGYAAAGFGLSLKDPFLRGAFLKKALTGWLLADRAEFYKWIQKQPPELALGRYVDVSQAGWWGKAQGPLSMKDLDILTSLNTRTSEWYEPMDAVFTRAWEESGNVEQAAAWISRQDDPTVRDSAWKTLGLKLAESDPAAAAGLAPQIADDERRRELTSTIAARLVRKNPQEAFAYAEGLQDEAARVAAWRSALATWAEADPAKSLAFVKEQGAGMKWTDLDVAAYRWGESSPLEALRVLMSVPIEGKSDDVLRRIVSQWHDHRPLEARRWLASDEAKAVPQAIRDRILKPGKREVQGYSTSRTTIGGRAVSLSH